MNARRLAAPAVLALAGPASVVLLLSSGRSVWLVFLVYHLGICLLAPLGLARLRQGRWDVRRHLGEVGLVGAAGGGRAAGNRRSPRLGAGLVLGIAGGVAVVAVFAGWGRWLLADEGVRPALAAWGVTSRSMPALFAVMLLGNGAAEELFWRGWLQASLAPLHPRALVVALTAALYAGYHAYTLTALLGDAPVVPLFTAAIFGAGLLWGWLRERTGTVWASLLSHTGATAGYMAVLWWKVLAS